MQEVVAVRLFADFVDASDSLFITEFAHLVFKTIADV